MENVERILVPVDFSECGPGVVQRAAQLAAQLNAEVMVMHALDKPRELAWNTMIQPESAAEPVSIRDHLRHGATERLPQFKVIIEAEGALAGEPVLAEGDPAEAILSTAKRLDADLIVMGTHGRVGLKRMLVGSVAESVLRRAEIPVLTVRSIHRAHCKAKGCSSCTSGLSAETLDVRSELDG